MHRRLSSVKLVCNVTVTSQRWATTGFGLFTAEVQRRERLLKAKCLQEGRQNMKVMSTLWRQLSRRERATYNNMANRMSVTRVRSAYKKHNVFNLVMRLLARHRELIVFGNEKLISLIAKQTVRVLRRDDIESLCELFNLRTATVLAVGSTGREQCAVLDMPDMKFFSSFTEMQRAVMPTRQSAYTAICKVLARHVERATHDERMTSFFQGLTHDEQNLFSPIADDEAAGFETFCAKYAAPMHSGQFNIIYLFAQYRGIAISDPAARPQHSERAALYHTLLAQDRVHDGIYFKVRRALERVQQGRSSDCGAYITACAAGRGHDTCQIVPPSSYGLMQGVDDVTVSTLLAQTRRSQSVYDDMLLRAAVLRPRSRAKKLEIYVVKKNVKHNFATPNVGMLQPVAELLKKPLSPAMLRTARRMAESAATMPPSPTPAPAEHSPTLASLAQRAIPQDAPPRIPAVPHSNTVEDGANVNKVARVGRRHDLPGYRPVVALLPSRQTRTAPSTPTSTTKSDNVAEPVMTATKERNRIPNAQRKIRRRAKNDRQAQRVRAEAAPDAIMQPRLLVHSNAVPVATGVGVRPCSNVILASQTKRTRGRRRVAASRRELMEQLRTALMHSQPKTAAVVKLASPRTTGQSRAVKPPVVSEGHVEVGTHPQSFADQLRAQLASVLG